MRWFVEEGIFTKAVGIQRSTADVLCPESDATWEILVAVTQIIGVNSIGTIAILTGWLVLVIHGSDIDLGIELAAREADYRSEKE